MNMNERKLYTKEELEALIAWFGNLPDCPKEIQVDKATYIPNLAETIDRLGPYLLRESEDAGMYSSDGAD